MKTKSFHQRVTHKKSIPTRPAIAEIDLQAISFNLKGIRSRVGKGVKIMAVVKANAYGHGLEPVSQFVERSLADYYGVAIAEEGIALREAGIKKPIHVFTLPTKKQASHFTDFNLESTICSADDIEVLNTAGRKAKKTIRAHVKIDTGMNRIGVRLRDVEGVMKALKKAERVEVKGVYTHFANSDSRDKSFLHIQLKEFEKALELFEKEQVPVELVHCANSAAILDVPETYYSMVRPGVTMYGYYPSRTTSESIPLKPAMTIKTNVALVKWIEAGESVSYGRRYVAQKRTRIATLPIGYADGITRLLSGRAHVLIAGQRFPVAGLICMDQLMVDVGETGVAVGDEAVLMGTQAGGTISAWELAETLGTIPYEICCAISSRVPRVYES